MALVLAHLSAKGRKRLAMAFMFINLFQVMVAIGLFFAAYKTYTCYGDLLHPIDKIQVHSIFRSIMWFANMVMVFYFVGAKIGYYCMNSAIVIRLGRIIAIWMIVGIFVIITAIVLLILAPTSLKNLKHEIRLSLKNGISHYLTDPVWKNVFDNLQQDIHCCGIDGYQDWHNISWLNIGEMNGSSNKVLKLAHEDGMLLPHATPWSCCNPYIQMPCLHDPLQQSVAFSLFSGQPDLIIQTMFREGCATKIQIPVTVTLCAAMLLGVLIIILQLILSGMLKFLYTASRNAIYLGSPDYTAPGWLLGRGDCGNTSRPTLAELSQKKVPEINSADVTPEFLSEDSDTETIVSLDKKSKVKIGNIKEKYKEFKDKYRKAKADESEVARLLKYKEDEERLPIGTIKHIKKKELIL